VTVLPEAGMEPALATQVTEVLLALVTVALRASVPLV
jgi:hypothetical protein